MEEPHSTNKRPHGPVARHVLLKKCDDLVKFDVCGCFVLFYARQQKEEEKRQPNNEHRSFGARVFSS
jgi:hypothetical protein